jgi:hypothetical protein
MISHKCWVTRRPINTQSNPRAAVQNSSRDSEWQV